MASPVPPPTARRRRQLTIDDRLLKALLFVWLRAKAFGNEPAHFQGERA